MALIGNALRQAFVPKQHNEAFDEENRAWSGLKKPLILSISLLMFLSVLVPAIISLHIVFPSEPSKRPFCRARRRLEEALPVNSTRQPELYRSQGGTLYATEEEAANYYWLVVFLPSAIVFLASVLYLVAGWWRSFFWDSPLLRSCLLPVVALLVMWYSILLVHYHVTLYPIMFGTFRCENVWGHLIVYWQ